MRILFLADGRSPIALNWIHHFTAGSQHEVHLASLYPCEPEMSLASLTIIPVAFSGAVGEGAGRGGLKNRLRRALATPRVRTWLRHQFVPRSLPRAAENLRMLISEVQPDVLHAMRIPYEGMTAALALGRGEVHPPLVVSVWGNDFTLHASATRRLADLSRLTMEVTDALHTDCRRDYFLACQWGFDARRPSIVLPGGGGIQRDVFYPPAEGERDPHLVVNPRGMRAYVRNDTFFRAIPQVLECFPQARFVCPAMQGQPEAEKWVRNLNLHAVVTLLPRQSRRQMADWFRKASVVVSPTVHDGTPNTLLEAMACGCFPVVGDIPSLWEWITPEVNGLLADPDDPQSLAEALCRALRDETLRQQAAVENVRLIAERADYPTVMAEAEAFYTRLLSLSS